MKVLEARSKRVALVLGARHNFWLDQRVQRTARALTAANYEVLAYTPAESRGDERHMEGIIARYINPPGGTNRLFNRLFLDYLLYNIPVALSMRRNKVHVCHCNDFDTLPSGVLLKLITLGKTKVVYDSHEDYPLFVEWGRGKLLARAIGIAEGIFTRYFVDRVIAVTETVKDKFEKRGIKSEAILNCQELLNYEPTEESQTAGDKKDEFQITYQGKIFSERGYEQLVEAADILINNRRIEELKFVIIGDSGRFIAYQRSLVNLIREKGLEKYFSFTGFIDYAEMMQMLRRADVGLMPFKPTLKNKGALPNKFFENLVAGIPTIASNVPEIARIISQEKCGLLVDATQPEEIADAIEYLYKHEDIKLEMGQNALRAAQEKYNFAKQAEKLLKVYEEIS